MKNLIFLISLFFLVLTNSEAQSDKRIALVIGNSNYDLGALKNPVNDAELMWAYAEAETDGLKLTFYYHIYTGSAGSIQVVAWTTSNIFERRIMIIDELIAGLRVN